MKEKELAVAEKEKFELRAKWNCMELYILEDLECHESDDWIKTKNLVKLSSSGNGKFSKETLDGGIITVVSEKYRFDYRDKSKPLLNFSTIGSMVEELKKQFLIRLLLHKCQAFAWDPDARNQTNRCLEKSVRMSIKIIRALLKINYYENSDSRKKCYTSHRKQLTTSREHPIET